MMHEDDLEYWLRRATEEAARALSLKDPKIATAHGKLAEAYRARITLLSSASAPSEAPLTVST